MAENTTLEYLANRLTRLEASLNGLQIQFERFAAAEANTNRWLDNGLKTTMQTLRAGMELACTTQPERYRRRYTRSGM